MKKKIDEITKNQSHQNITEDSVLNDLEKKLEDCKKIIEEREKIRKKNR